MCCSLYKADSDIDIDMEDIVSRLMEQQLDDMLDRTKCSITARNVFNALSQSTTGIHGNDTLSNEPANLCTFAERLRGAAKDGSVSYVHFDHVTGESSHFFVVVQLPGRRVCVLQSAVFEFSLRDWVLTDEAEAALEEETRVVCIDLNDDDPYDAVWIEQAKRMHKRGLDILHRIRECPFSGGRTFELEEFISMFVDRLKGLEGAWEVARIPELCDLYAELFSCRLNVNMMRSHVSLGAKPASIRLVLNKYRPRGCEVAAPH